jgi:hypothetical protein
VIHVAKRLLYPAMMAALLTALVPLMATAWSAGNSCGSSTYKICVSKDDNNTVPRATTNLSDSNYAGDKYFNTTINIDDSVSSMQNWYSNRDVDFFRQPNYALDAMCVDSLYGYTSISFVWDDTFSSHILYAVDSTC